MVAAQLHHWLPLIIIALPLMAAPALGLGRWWLGTSFLATTALLSGYMVLLSYDGAAWPLMWTAPSNHVHWLRLRVDFAAALFVALTTIIGLFTHLYAASYLQDPKRHGLLTSGFISIMIGSWMADHLLGYFIGWELMSWGSYCLIAYWHEGQAAARGSTTVWLVNQVGSVLLLIGLLLLSHESGTWHLEALRAWKPASAEAHPWLGIARFCCVAGIGTKSVQWPWFVWLPHAMAAPTPTSALIHSATLVGAGVYLLVNLSPVLGVTALTVVAYWGALTSFMGAGAALVQQHAKKVLAYSTVSQLGYVVMGIGMGAHHVSFLYFITHAFAKACLFLSIGIAARQAGTADMAQMGGLRKQLPVTFGAYIFAAFSLLGIPGWAGSLPKKGLLASTWAWANQQALAGSYLGYSVPLLAWLTTLLSVLYLSRQAHQVFMGPQLWKPTKAVTVPRLMVVSLLLLSLGTLGFGHGPLLGYVQNSWILQRLGGCLLPLSETLQRNTAWISYMVGCLGLCLYVAHLYYKPIFYPERLYRALQEGWYVDLWLDWLVKGAISLSQQVAFIEQAIVQKLIAKIATGYVAIAQFTALLETHLLNRLIVGLAVFPQRISAVYFVLQQGSWHKLLLLMSISMGLLLTMLYWLA